MEEAYERLFGEKPRGKCRSPLPKGDHPELDHSKFLGEEETEIYQSLIGSMQENTRVNKKTRKNHRKTRKVSFRGIPSLKKWARD